MCSARLSDAERAAYEEHLPRVARTAASRSSSSRALTDMLAYAPADAFGASPG